MESSMGLNHLACIMDGNRRWAIRQGLLSFFGHRKGLDALKLVIDFCLDKQIRHLSLYTFSTENLQRPAQEQQYLFEVLAQEAAAELKEFKQKNVRMKFIGDRGLFPKSVQPLCDKIEQETAHCTGLDVNFLLCYGGRQEIIAAAQRIATDVAQGRLKVEDISPKLFEENLWTAGIPSPDLIIRTGGQKRLSNFLLYQCAYTELYFLDCMWPEISAEKLENAVDWYNQAQKNFGK